MKLKAEKIGDCMMLLQSNAQADGKSDLVAEVHTSLEDAQRIAACVNACECINTDDLNEYCVVSAKEYREIERQRDELLAAAEKAVQVLKQYHDRFMSAGRWEEDSYRQKSLVYRDIMKAITKVKGGVE